MSQQITSGVYRLTNTATGKQYIGRSQNIERRIKQHFSKMKSGSHENSLMQADWDNGYQEFRWELLEKVTYTIGNINVSLMLREREWIKQENPSYNISCTERAPHLEENRLKYPNLMKSFNSKNELANLHWKQIAGG